MKVFGIEFAPLNTPLHRRLETLGITIGCFLVIGLSPTSIAIAIYILCFTKYWWLMLVYIAWMIIDKDTPERGGRPNKWVRSWTVFKYCTNYFPVKARVLPGFSVDPKLNYLCAWFPHGFLPLGIPPGLTSGYGSEFANHTVLTNTINANFYVPFYREFILWLGMCKASPKSLNYLLSNPNGGNMVILPVGGSSEALNFKSGEYRITLKNRKGFVKLALKNGVPIIPMFSFGENDLWKHIIFPEDSLIRRVQLWVRKKTNFSPIILSGRGWFQYTFGLLPFRTPINIVVGHPLMFGKIEDPTPEELDAAHQKFIDALTSIFEEYKYHYEANPEQCRLIIE